jgi:hypothetical protein
LNFHQDLVRDVTFRVAELGLSEHIVPYVLEALKESDQKSLSKLKKSTKKKKTDINKAQAQPRFVSSMRRHAEEAKKQLNRLLDNFGDQLLKTVRQHVFADLSFSRLKTRSSLLFKNTAATCFQLGIKAAGLVSPQGGLYPLTKDEKEWLNKYITAELKYFDKFLKSLENLADTTIEKRVKRYVASMNYVYESGKVLSVGSDVIIHWVIESNNPCPDCKLINRYSPFVPATLPTTPKAGHTRCLDRCYCSLRIVKSSKSEVNKILKKNRSSAWMLKKLKENRKLK